MDVGNLFSSSSAFSKSSLNIWKFIVHALLKPGLENFEHYFGSMWDECSCAVVWAFFVYAPPSNAEETEVEWFYEDLQGLLELTPQKTCPFHYRGLECKSRKSRNTWSNRQIWPWNMEWSRAKANRVLPRECTGHSNHPLPTTQEKTLHMDITRWSTPKSDWLYSL